MPEKKFSPKQLMLFDLDGTVVDSVPDIAVSVDLMMTAMGRAACGEPMVRKFIGNGATRLIERALTGDMDGKPDPQEYQRAHKLFFEFYSDNVCEKSRLYPGARQALEELHSSGYILVCITNKPATFTQPLLESLEVVDLFKLVLAGDSLEKKKPDPLPLTYAAEKLEVSLEQTIMIGDSSNDIQAARAAGVDCIAVSYGYNHGQDIALSGPDLVIDNLNELPAILRV